MLILPSLLNQIKLYSPTTCILEHLCKGKERCVPGCDLKDFRPCRQEQKAENRL